MRSPFPNLFGGPSGRRAVTLHRVVRRNLLSHPVRAILTIAAVSVGIFLFCFLTSIVTSLADAVKAVSTNRIFVGSAVSLFQSLPTTSTYRDGIGEMEGVESVTRFTWFGGVPPGEEAPRPQFGTDPAILLSQYPEVIVPPAEAQAWFDDKQGCIVGRLLAEELKIMWGTRSA